MLFPAPQQNCLCTCYLCTPILNLTCSYCTYVNQLMGKVNKERLGEFLGELQRKEETNDRYVAALKGQTLTRNPYERIQPVTTPTTSQVDK